MNTIHNRMKVFRVAKGLSRQQLADVVGVNPQTIGYLERQDYNPSLLLAFKIAVALDAPLEAIFSTKPFESLADTLHGN